MRKQKEMANCRLRKEEKVKLYSDKSSEEIKALKGD